MFGYAYDAACINVHPLGPHENIEARFITWTYTIFFLCAHEKMYASYPQSPEIVQPNPYTKISISDLQDLFSKDEPKEKESSSCQFLIIGVVILVVVVLMMSFKDCKRGFSDLMSHSSISGKKSHTKGVDCHAKTDFSDFKVENLTHCSETDSKCKDFKKVDETLKIQNGSKLKEFDESNTNVMYMVYAPWCPHCHTALPKFCEASKKSDVKFALVNAELVPPTLLQGKDALLSVTHFPFLCHKNKEKNILEVFKGAPTAENIVAFAEKEEADPPPKKKDPLDMMFA